MTRYLNGRFASLQPYTPGEQPQNRAFIKLNTNESPYPPSPAAVRAAAGEAERMQLYSDPTLAVFLKPLADYLGVSADRVTAGNGSDEILAFLFQGFCESGAAFADLTYGFYPVYCGIYGVDAKIIPLEEDFSLNPKAYAGLRRTIFIANPNAPTGLSLTRKEIEGILGENAGSLVVIDEAYVDFGAESVLPLLADYENLAVVGTFSKSRSMAGARLGYMAASAGIIEDFNRIKFSFNPYNVNRMTLAAGAAALADSGYFERCRADIVSEREAAKRSFRRRGYTCTDSMANFLFVRHPSRSGESLYRGLRERGILVRWFDKDRIRDYLRITVGNGGEMKALFAALDEMEEGGGHA